jgi:hypothetical protein
MIGCAEHSGLKHWLQQKREKFVGYYALEFLYFCSLYFPNPSPPPTELNLSLTPSTSSSSSAAAPAPSASSSAASQSALSAVSAALSRAVPTAAHINTWYQRLLFSRSSRRVAHSTAIFNFDCLFKQYVNEWAIPYAACGEALHRLNALINQHKLQVHFPVEVRFVADDGPILLSPTAGRNQMPSCYIGIIM